jgi:hypothetical protein
MFKGGKLLESMKLKKYRTYAVAILLLLTLVISGIAFKANAATTAAISYSSSKSTVRAGDSFDINVNIAGVSSLYGASIDFKYDPALFKINGISKGSIFGTVNSGTPVNNTSSGLISFYCTLQGASAGLNSTSTKALFVIHAKALKNGSVNLKTIATNGTLSNTGNNIRIKLADSTKATNPIKYTASGKTLNVGGVAPVSIGSVAVDKASPQLIGAKVKITANASGGANKLYKFSVLQGSTWKVVRDYSSTNYYYWTPAKAGSYKIKAEVKDGTNGKAISKEISYTINSGISFSSIKTDKASPQVVKAKIKVSAYASGGSSLLYRFKIYNGSSWYTVRNYSSSSTYYWTPTKAANHKIKVEVKDSKTGKIVSKEISYTVSSGVKVTAISTSKAAPQKRNTTIKLTAKTSGSANLLYKFSIYDGRYWRVVRNFSSSSTYSWKPTKAATYKIWVDVKDVSTGKKAYRQIYYKIS